MNLVELELDETLADFEIQDWIDNVFSVQYPEIKAKIKHGCSGLCHKNKDDWHYIKSEEDLPKDNSEYLLLLEHGIRAFGYYNGKFWESWNGDLSWQEVKAYYDVPVPDEDKLNDKKE